MMEERGLLKQPRRGAGEVRGIPGGAPGGLRGAGWGASNPGVVGAETLEWFGVIVR
jgi:hypothetical protein